jgi:hypothetical protein
LPNPVSGTATTFTNDGDSIYASFTSGSCVSPAGTEQQIIYNTDYHTLQFCNGANWIPLGPGSGAAPIAWWKFDESSGRCHTNRFYLSLLTSTPIPHLTIPTP